MSGPTASDPAPAGAELTRTAASVAVEGFGWRYLLGSLLTSVATPDLAAGVEAARAVVVACGDAAAAHLRVDLRPGHVELSLQTREVGAVTMVDVRLAQACTAALATLGLTTAGATSRELARPVQALELAIDALDIAAVLPFWRAVLAYVDDPAGEGAIVDPRGQQPALWFQQLDEARTQRNRIHLDLTVAHDEAEARVAAALAAGGTLLSDASARSFWILADAEGNEVCVCTWQDRDERDAALAG